MVHAAERPTNAPHAAGTEQASASPAGWAVDERVFPRREWLRLRNGRRLVDVIVLPGSGSLVLGSGHGVAVVGGPTASGPYGCTCGRRACAHRLAVLRAALLAPERPSEGAVFAGTPLPALLGVFPCQVGPLLLGRTRHPTAPYPLWRGPHVGSLGAGDIYLHWRGDGRDPLLSRMTLAYATGRGYGVGPERSARLFAALAAAHLVGAVRPPRIRSGHHALQCTSAGVPLTWRDDRCLRPSTGAGCSWRDAAGVWRDARAAAEPVDADHPWTVETAVLDPAAAEAVEDNRAFWLDCGAAILDPTGFDRTGALLAHHPRLAPTPVSASCPALSRTADGGHTLFWRHARAGGPAVWWAGRVVGWDELPLRRTMQVLLLAVTDARPCAGRPAGGPGVRFVATHLLVADATRVGGGTPPPAIAG